MATRLLRDKGVICWAAAPPRTKPDPINNIWTETAEFQTMMLLNFSTVSSHAIEPARLVGNGNDCEYCRYESTIITLLCLLYHAIHNRVQPTLMARNAFEKLLYLYLCMKIKMNFLQSNILCQIFCEL